MTRAAAVSILIVVFSASTAYGRDSALIRVSYFAISDQTRTQEIASIEDWHRRQKQAEARATFERMKAEDDRQRENWGSKGELTRPIPLDFPDSDVQQVLSDMGLKTVDDLVQNPNDSIEFLERLNWERPGFHERDARIYDATRGMEPEILEECFVSEGREVAAAGQRKERQFKRYYRVEKIDARGLLMELSETWGTESDRYSLGAQGHAYYYPFGTPILRSIAGVTGQKPSYDVEFIEVEPLLSAATDDSCIVSYPATGGPPMASHGRGETNSHSSKQGTAPHSDPRPRSVPGSAGP